MIFDHQFLRARATSPLHSCPFPFLSESVTSDQWSVAAAWATEASLSPYYLPSPVNPSLILASSSLCNAEHIQSTEQRSLFPRAAPLVPFRTP